MGAGLRTQILLLAFIREDGETQLWLWQFDEDAMVSDVAGV
jgi:hypothetical protein